VGKQLSSRLAYVDIALVAKKQINAVLQTRRANYGQDAIYRALLHRDEWRGVRYLKSDGSTALVVVEHEELERQTEHLLDNWYGKGVLAIVPMTHNEAVRQLALTSQQFLLQFLPETWLPIIERSRSARLLGPITRQLANYLRDSMPYWKLPTSFLLSRTDGSCTLITKDDYRAPTHGIGRAIAVFVNRWLDTIADNCSADGYYPIFR